MPENTPHLIDGKQTAEDIKVEIAAEVAALKAAGQQGAAPRRHPRGPRRRLRNLRAQQGAGLRAGGLRSARCCASRTTLRRPNCWPRWQQLNDDPEIDGFIVQLPLPKHIDPEKVIEAIRPEKDVDGFHPMNMGRMVAGLPALLPATPSGIVELLARQGIKTSGKHCVVIGRSNIVGTPVSILLAKNLETANCTVTLCHSRTQNLAEICRQADIVVAAIGRPEFVTADMVKPGAVVIDVGTTRVAGRQQEERLQPRRATSILPRWRPLASAITPVPGGVGPMTIAMLLLNTLRAAKGEVYPSSSAHLA